MAPFEALYGRNCRTPLCWTELDKDNIIGLEKIQKTKERVEVIKDRLKDAFDRQKYYANLKRRDIEYAVGDKVFLKVSPWKKALRFGRNGKLSLRFIGLYEIIEHVGPLALKLALPLDLDMIHNILHVSMLRRYWSDPSHVISAESISIEPDLTYEGKPIRIIAKEVKDFRYKRMSLVKVSWRNHKIEKATWESEDIMRQQHPQLFTSDKF
ncbi:uncharacterized protein LOC105628906 [Jatropha curcas]|uniref:uncharacterized protein LOC105628906 n=1 Tax=Jatropha curcas TaxID=180498 RepID=UPI0005FB35C6|nr:uncharacterized protein LOC105628906 [Jatropha curcas]